MKGEFAAQVGEEHIGHLGHGQAVLMADAIFVAALHCPAAGIGPVENIHRHVAAGLLAFPEEVYELAVETVEAVSRPLPLYYEGVNFLGSKCGCGELVFVQKHDVPPPSGENLPEVAFYLGIPRRRAFQHGEAAVGQHSVLLFEERCRAEGEHYSICSATAITSSARASACFAAGASA